MNKNQEALNRVNKAITIALACQGIDLKEDNETVLALITLQELVDKSTLKKPNFLNYGGYKIGNWHCPNCDSIIILDSRKPKPPKRCEECDQLLDWSNTNE